MDPWITIRTTNRQHEAALWQSVLENAGIEAILENEIAMSWGFGETAGGINLKVRAADAQEAADLLGGASEGKGET